MSCHCGTPSLVHDVACPERDRDPVEREVDEMFADEPACTAATHGPRNSTCTCEDSRGE